MKLLLSKYEAANKEYQTQLANAKLGKDVYNMLSTGQLNGLAIAFLLAVRNVYGHPKGLDNLQIDDPLQKRMWL